MFGLELSKNLCKSQLLGQLRLFYFASLKLSIKMKRQRD
ncbi:hypothetical protein Cabys_2644 [Caldithrix abyssi DSM 13497]|uniref:Uncharacterized protein n=1 Tax=Caldithrix abyssi DSM 13497 TaxID=880073 RepID=A0A1J1CAU6_CALAY|nr:hypothetical protein Cabys_2644 [Caldithrix abyssi DSM 13497]